MFFYFEKIVIFILCVSFNLYIIRLYLIFKMLYNKQNKLEDRNMDENLLLTLLHNNARMEVTDLAMALNEIEDNVVKTINQLEKDKVICGYHTIINWDRTNVDNVMALIQINATPEREYGYDRIAKKIYAFPEVDTMYLLSGSFEFVAIVKGHTMQEAARFVASKLAPLEGVTGTATMFVLKQYKNNGISFDDNDKEAAERLLVTP